jgi:peptidoglycan/xylan/chitin deacetylase (PgdA/CDA1 family)
VSTTEASTLVDGKPRQYVDALSRRPIVLVFYAPGGVDDEKVLSAARELQTAFSGYTFLMYDYRVPAAYGDLTKELKAAYNVDFGYLPVTLLIRRDGTAATKWSGYVDKGTLNQALINLGRL